MSDRAAFARLDSENEVAELRRELGVVTDERDTALADSERLRDEAERSFPATWAGFRAFLAEHYPADVFFPGDDRDLGPQFVVAARTIAEVRAERDALSAVIDKVREWAMVNEIAAVPLDWAGLGAILNPLAAGLAAPVGETPRPKRYDRELHRVAVPPPEPGMGATIADITDAADSGPALPVE